MVASVAYTGAVEVEVRILRQAHGPVQAVGQVGVGGDRLRLVDPAVHGEPEGQIVVAEHVAQRDRAAAVEALAEVVAHVAHRRPRDVVGGEADLVGLDRELGRVGQRVVGGVEQTRHGDGGHELARVGGPAQIGGRRGSPSSSGRSSRLHPPAGSCRSGRSSYRAPPAAPGPRPGSRGWWACTAAA